MPIPRATPFDWSELHPIPGRFARSIRSSPDGCRIALFGLPDDTGVALNYGRPGARHGPRAFREALARYGAAHDAISGSDLTALGLFDAGDVEPAGDEIERTHRRVTEAVETILDLGLLPVCVGGGHDLTFAAVRALWSRQGNSTNTNPEPRTPNPESIGGLNIDTHLDVRERLGSGMTFRRIIEDGRGVVDPKRFATVGVGPFSNSAEHLDWLRQRGAELVLFDGDQHALYRRLEETLSLLADAPALFASFDLDVLDGSVAPGVSAINPMGLTPVTASMICRAIGRLPNVRYFDLMELSPPHDVHGRTARLAAHLFLSFLAGVAQRR